MEISFTFYESNSCLPSKVGIESKLILKVAPEVFVFGYWDGENFMELFDDGSKKAVYVQLWGYLN